MKNMWRRIKDWLIKKLGGYTDKEYKTATDFTVKHVIFDPVRMHPHTIRARMYAPMICPGLSCSQIEYELSLLLAEELRKNKLVSYRHCTDTKDMTMAYEASIKVLKEDNDGKID